MLAIAHKRQDKDVSVQRMEDRATARVAPTL